MCARRLENRIESRGGEPGRDPRELHRRQQKCLARALAVLGVITFAAVRSLPEKRAVRRAAIDELGRNDTSHRDRFAVDVARFVEHAEAIALMQIVVEIDVARENIGECQRDRVGQTHFVRRAEQ